VSSEKINTMSKKYPPSIISTTPGSWSHSTVTIRWPDIAQRVINENTYSSNINSRIKDLQEDILQGKIRNLNDSGAPDTKEWLEYTKSYLGKSWQEVPWFFAEHYFYRRLIEAVGYFSNGVDPFHNTKEQGLLAAMEDTRGFCEVLTNSLAVDSNLKRVLLDMIFFSLWGNQADLSLWPAGDEKNSKHSSRLILRKFLLEDHSKQVINRLTKSDKTLKRVDFMVDNAGFELVTDLGFVDILLAKGITERVVLHVKYHPTFVSDVVARDIKSSVDYLLSSSDQHIKAFGKRLRSYLSEGRIIPREDLYWNSPLPMWEIPENLKDELSRANFLVSKGDANYRRLLGDREWDITDPFHQVVDYLPAPLVALRTLKAELAVGMTLEQVQEVYNQDSDWMVNGRWGVIQFAPGLKDS
jgi:uncharacterized protein with ATP-grasp and redox domains